ncbi:Chorion peroxidase, partial [Araneus ventricosus]
MICRVVTRKTPYDPKLRSGKPRVADIRSDRRIQRMASSQKMSVREITGASRLQISKNTVHRRIIESGYMIHAKMARRLPLSKLHISKLRSSGRNKGYLLPAGKDKRDGFCPKGQDSNCFLSGDFRVNMHASLTTLQTVYMRQHNRRANELKKINPHWGEEKLFQEARKILIAEHQCITYKEYLPILLGSHIVELFDLTVRNGPRGTLHSSQVVLAVFQEHAAAAFRLHSMVPTYIGLSDFQFKDTYANPSMVRKGYISNITAGSYQVPSEKYDRWVVKDLSDYFGQQPGVPYGTDLSAIDIQRGRDHGLAPYVEV